MSQHILIVSNFFPPETIGGAEIVAYRQARALAARGYEVTVLAGAQPSDKRPPGTLSFDLYEGIPVYRLSVRSLDPNLNFHWPAAAARLRAVIQAREIDIVHFHNVVGMGANLIPQAKAAGARCLVTLHDHWGFCFQQTRLRSDGSVCENYEDCAKCLDHVTSGENIALPMRLRRDYVMWCLNQADHLLVPSTYLHSAYTQAGISADRMTVLSNGIELQLFPSSPKQPSSEAKVRFLWTGYLGEHKGVLVFLEALEILAQDASLASKWQVTMAGEGHLRPKVETALGSSRLKDKVRFVGRLPRAEIIELLGATDVTVLTSVWPENEPVTLLEAIASGTAQIATRLGGNTELVEERRSGLLVSPNNAAEIAAAMRSYILDPPLAANHGRYNFERRAHFDETRTIDKLEAFLHPSENPTAGSEDSSRLREPVIICSSSRPPQQVSIMLNRVHDHPVAGVTPRFVWHEWVELAIWRDAVLLWLWDGEPAEALTNDAMRRGIPVLAPRTDRAEGLARHYGSMVLYRTYLEALAALRALLSNATLRTEFSGRAHASAATATALAAREAFSLRAQRIL
jgi:glycosyltransferase involved in cell wall biosynthesis